MSPKLYFYDSNKIIPFAGCTPLSKITLRNKTIGYRETDCEAYNTPYIIPYAHGAAMMISRKTISTVGIMPENYFLYYEELDWCTQITKAGYEIWYEPKCSVYHKESQSTGYDSPLKLYYLTRNRLIYAKRNLSSISSTLSIFYQLFLANSIKLITLSFKGKFSYVSAIIRGCKDFILKPKLCI